MIFFSSVHFRLGYPMWALPEADDLDSQVQLRWVCEGECVAAGAKLLQGVGGKRYLMIMLLTSKNKYTKVSSQAVLNTN